VGAEIPGAANTIAFGGDRHVARRGQEGAASGLGQPVAEQAERVLRSFARRLDHDAPGVSASIYEGLDEMLYRDPSRPACPTAALCPLYQCNREPANCQQKLGSLRFNRACRTIFNRHRDDPGRRVPVRVTAQPRRHRQQASLFEQPDRPNVQTRMAVR
jgi:hypothetical protein